MNSYEELICEIFVWNYLIILQVYLKYSILSVIFIDINTCILFVCSYKNLNSCYLFVWYFWNRIVLIYLNPSFKSIAQIIQIWIQNNS